MMIDIIDEPYHGKDSGYERHARDCTQFQYPECFLKHAIPFLKK